MIGKMAIATALRGFNDLGHLGRFPLDQKFQKFQVKSEWKRHCPESHLGILGVPREVVPIFRKIGITGKFCSIRHMEYLKFQTRIFGRMERTLHYPNISFHKQICLQ